MDWKQPLQRQPAALQWFTESHLQSVVRNGSVPEWFHGIISRNSQHQPLVSTLQSKFLTPVSKMRAHRTAEALLMSKPPGYFLIRVSESRIGYTLSYRADKCCRHYMIDVSDDGQCVVVGEDKRHLSLHDLVEFHQRAPIAPFNEVLTAPCRQPSSEGCDYAALLFPQRPSPHQDRPVPVDWSRLCHQNSQDDAPPVTGDPNTCAAVTPGRQSLRFYPILPEYPLAATSCTASVALPPVPKTRSKYLVDAQPPRVSAKKSPGAVNTGPSKNPEAKSSFVSKILRKKFQKRTRSLQEFRTPDASSQVDDGQREAIDEQNFDLQQHFSCTDSTLAGRPQEYRLPPPFAPGYS